MAEVVSRYPAYWEVAVRVGKAYAYFPGFYTDKLEAEKAAQRINRAK